MSPLAEVRDATPPPIERVYRRVARRRARRRWVAAAATVAAAVLLVVVVPHGVRDRGLALQPMVSLDAVAEGGSGPRALRDGDPVGAAERVVFFVRSSVDGEATIREDGGAVVDRWPMRAGESAVGGDQPLAWRPDQPGTRGYVLEVCPDGAATSIGSEAGCGSARLTLRWTP